MQATTVDTDILIYQPTLEDAKKMYALVEASPPLELNSCYTYLLLSSHFASGCAIATQDGRTLGFLGAYIPPSNPDALFVWQVAVAEEARGKGIARRLMENVLKRESSSAVRWLEASVTPSNEASRRLFQGAAAKWGVACEVTDWLEREHFNSDEHEPEELFRIGPLNKFN